MIASDEIIDLSFEVKLLLELNGYRIDDFYIGSHEEGGITFSKRGFNLELMNSGEIIYNGSKFKKLKDVKWKK